jgi:hypothetical protein
LETMLSKPTNTPKLLFGYFSNVLENYYWSLYSLPYESKNTGQFSNNLW